MNSPAAEALSLLVLQLNAKMNDSLAFVKEKGEPEEFTAYRLQAAEVMGALHGIAETLYARHPHLRPAELGGTYSIDPAVFKDRFYVPEQNDDVQGG
ncbi:hypothetical protein [Polaromonas sp. LjRoot131]|uniref:hypothetical protein n=1 Tax=Polaromonas sp. LjRoot131 TaxID=3342262 RepID=UPI003ECC5671